MQNKINDNLVAQLIHLTNRLYISDFNGKTYSRDNFDGIIVDPDTIKIAYKRDMIGRSFVEVSYEATITMKGGRYTHLRLAPQVPGGDFKKSGMKWAQFSNDNSKHIDGIWPQMISL